MTIRHETEIVATRYDAQTRVCRYTIERGGKRWTVALRLADLDAAGKNQKRRDLVAHALENAMRGEPDE